ncbi:MAG: hypothetical protein JW839_22730 [Candidatus Lokiarchaeota archaeon]|nr:hypothetical protein [Candidatus Lokiarchaeota archaeon]
MAELARVERPECSSTDTALRIRSMHDGYAIWTCNACHAGFYVPEDFSNRAVIARDIIEADAGDATN